MSGDADAQRTTIMNMPPDKLRFLCLCCFLIVSFAFFVLGKCFYDYQLREAKEVEIKEYQARRFMLAGYEIGQDIDSVDGYHRFVQSNGVSRAKSKTAISAKVQPLRYGYHKVVPIAGDEVIDGMKGFFKLDVAALESMENGVTRNRICWISLTANGLPDKMRQLAVENYVALLEKRFGRRRFGRRLDQITGYRHRDEKFTNWTARMDLENGRCLHVSSHEPGHISVVLHLSSFNGAFTCVSP